VEQKPSKKKRERLGIPDGITQPARRGGNEAKPEEEDGRRRGVGEVLSGATLQLQLKGNDYILLPIRRVYRLSVRPLWGGEGG
jgi:hypothetical protein